MAGLVSPEPISTNLRDTGVSLTDTERLRDVKQQAMACICPARRA